jgi:hypothetical protein
VAYGGLNPQPSEPQSEGRQHPRTPPRPAGTCRRAPRNGRLRGDLAGEEGFEPPVDDYVDAPKIIWSPDPVTRSRCASRTQPAVDCLDDVRCAVVWCSCGLSFSSALTVPAAEQGMPGFQRVAAIANRTDPQPASTTRFGSWAIVQATIGVTISGGV